MNSLENIRAAPLSNDITEMSVVIVRSPAFRNVAVNVLIVKQTTGAR